MKEELPSDTDATMRPEASEAFFSFGARNEGEVAPPWQHGDLQTEQETYDQGETGLEGAEAQDIAYENRRISVEAYRIEFAERDRLRMEFALAEQDKEGQGTTPLLSPEGLARRSLEQETPPEDTKEPEAPPADTHLKQSLSDRQANFTKINDLDRLPARFAQNVKELMEEEENEDRQAEKRRSWDEDREGLKEDPKGPTEPPLCVSVIIGGSSGLGRALCKLLGSELPAYLQHRGYHHR
eukprot:1185669-Prorocentrum_minimum.AAC.3